MKLINEPSWICNILVLDIKWYLSLTSMLLNTKLMIINHNLLRSNFKSLFHSASVHFQSYRIQELMFREWIVVWRKICKYNGFRRLKCLTFWDNMSPSDIIWWLKILNFNAWSYLWCGEMSFKNHPQ